MTERKDSLRKRRRAGSDSIPREIRAWFAGEPRQPGQARFPWRAVAFPGFVLLADWWAIFKTENPDALPPAGAEHLCEPAEPPRGHRLELLIIARKQRTKRRS